MPPTRTPKTQGKSGDGRPKTTPPKHISGPSQNTESQKTRTEKKKSKENTKPQVSGAQKTNHSGSSPHTSKSGTPKTKTRTEAKTSPSLVKTEKTGDGKPRKHRGPASKIEPRGSWYHGKKADNKPTRVEHIQQCIKPVSLRRNTSPTQQDFELKYKFDLINEKLNFLPPTGSTENPLDLFQQLISMKVKLMIVIVGCPGSAAGLAQKILTRFGAPTATHHAICIDDYFFSSETGRSHFDHNYLPNALIWAQKVVQMCALEGRSPIIVENLMRHREIRDVCTIAVANGYVFEVVQPNSEWFIEGQSCVPAAYNREKTGPSLMARYNLKYKAHSTPPQICSVSFETPISEQHTILLKNKMGNLPFAKPKLLPSPIDVPPEAKPLSPTPLIDLSVDSSLDGQSGEAISLNMNDLLGLDFSKESVSGSSSNRSSDEDESISLSHSDGSTDESESTGNFTDSSASEAEDCDFDELSLTVNLSLVSQMNVKFGSLLNLAAMDEKLVVNIPEELARELYFCIQQTNKVKQFISRTE